MTEHALVGHAAGSPRRSARYERRREKIIDVASALLNEKGIWGMTLLDVAKALDLTTTSVTYYYRYKEQLAAAAFEDTLDRLNAMTTVAAGEPTPQARVRRYIDIYLNHHAQALRGETRPLVMLSELRALEDTNRAKLIARYQSVFRNARSLFGPADTPERKRAYTARTQVLNEALLWSAIWLRRYPVNAFPQVARRLFDVLEKGMAIPGTVWEDYPTDPDLERVRDAKSEFLCTATRLINDIGYRGASVERIVGELNITKGSFYHHHNAKDELVADCFRDSYRRLSRLQQMIETQTVTVWNRIATMIASALALQFDGRDPLLRTTALHAMPPSLRAEAIAHYDRFTLALSGIVVDGMVDGSVRILDPLIAAQVTLSTINAAYDLRGWARKSDRTEAISIYGSTLMSGIFANISQTPEG